MVGKLTNMEWLTTWMKRLEVTHSIFKQDIDEILKIEPRIFNDFHEWTPLKLILVQYALDVCTPIIKNYKFFTKMYFIDLFAGTGINRMTHKGDLLIGSPLIAALNYGAAYDELIFCEKDPKCSEALKNRLNYLKKVNISIMPGDCNECLDEILQKVNNPHTYSLFFIDPNSMEFPWESMKKVLHKKTDILFTFMTSEINRTVGLVRKGQGDFSVLKKFLGDIKLEEINDEDSLPQVFGKNILKERPNAKIVVIKIKSKKFHFCYHMFFITNETKGGNRWLRAFEKARKEIENNSDKAVEAALDIVKNRQDQLNSYF